MDNLDEQYLRDLGIADMPEEARRPLVEKLEQQIQDRISLRMAEDLSDEQLEELANITESAGDDQGKVVEWLEQNAPNYKEIIEETLKEVKEEMSVQRAEVPSN